MLRNVKVTPCVKVVLCKVGLRLVKVRGKKSCPHSRDKPRFGECQTCFGCETKKGGGTCIGYIFLR